MYSHGHVTDMAECIVLTEIRDWFKKLITETCGPDIHIRYLSDGGHFSSHTNVEISGSNSQVNQAVEIIRNTYDEVRYKMPWLNENTYYSRNTKLEKSAEQFFNSLKDYSYFHFISNMKYMSGVPYIRCIFRPALNDNMNILIEKVFKKFSFGPPIFIMYPKIKAPLNQSSSSYMTTNILTAFHGKFLSYLNTEDIFSLELANKRLNGSYCDVDLDHDIQKFLRTKYPSLYGSPKIDISYNLKDFRINDVLRYFIHKYHDRLTKISISNILTADEIQSLSRSCHIEIEHHTIIHIDFKSKNDLETVEFCAIYHFDPNSMYFLNYDPEYATENYSVNFRADGSLDPLQCRKEFSHFVLKSQNNCSPQKSNSVLKYVAQHFKANENISRLVLYEFDLNHAPKQILSSLLRMMSPGGLQFHEMSFKLNTLIAILELADTNNCLMFKKCHITFENVETVPNISAIKYLQFINMDIDLNVMSILKNIETLEIDNCCIVPSKREFPINMENVNFVYISLTSLDITTVRRVMKGLQCARTLVYFVACHVTPSDHIEKTDFTVVRNRIIFENMIFEIPILFQIFENCEFQNPLVFKGCHFRFENDASYKFSLNPVNVEFYYITFDSSVLLTILAKLNKGSKICISKSRIFGTNADILIKKIGLNFVNISNCRLETLTLLNILGKLSRETNVLIDRCDLLHSGVVYSNILTDLSSIIFRRMKMNSNDLFAILDVLKDNSSAYFAICEITGDSDVLLKMSLQKKIKIYFECMTIPSQIGRIALLQTDWTVDFNNCNLEFMTNEFSGISIQSNVTFRNMSFNSYEQYKCLAKFCTSKSRITFHTCHFDFSHFRIPIIVIQPLWILFYRTSIDLDGLVTFMQMISEQTHVSIKECNIQSPNRLLCRRPIKFKTLHFVNTNLEIEIILCVLKNFISLSHLHFANCKIVYTKPNQLSNTKLINEQFIVENMDIDIQIFHTFVRKCVKGVTVSVKNCKIKPVRNKTLPNVSLELGRLVLKDVKYSPELLQILQYLNAQCIVEYHDQLSNKAITEICTKTFVHGKRFILTTQICTASIYYELFAEFFRPMALNFECDTEVAFDLPTYLIPDIRTLSSCSKYNWDAYKIKFILVNDATMKVEFLKNSKPIDLYFELYDLSDDSEESVLQYN